ncbi:MAG: DUF3179 domain-containing (seleno)protein [Salinirussus sp.]
MRRRRFLTLAGSLPAMAGCLGAPTAGGSPPNRPPIPRDVSLPVPESEIIHDPFSVILAIQQPAFAADWSDIRVRTETGTKSASLAADATVIGVERDGRARAYPLSILQQHEIVNDSFGGPLLISYCPICASGMAAERRVRGVETRFEVSLNLWRNNLVLRDRLTRSLWSQVLAMAIRGEVTGDRLDLVPSTMTRWETWQKTYPDTEVLLPPPYSATKFGNGKPGPVDPSYLQRSSRVNRREDGLRTIVIGVATESGARAYPFDAVRRAGPVNDTVGSVPVVVAVAAGANLVAFDRRVDGEILTFEAAGDSHLRGGGSTWDVTTGRAIDGPYAGEQLRSAASHPPMYRFTWFDFHPDSTVFEP